MKRLLANRPTWKRILQKRFYCAYLNSPEFNGHATLLYFEQVQESLWKTTGGKTLCLVDQGYSWLQHFPKEEHYSVTTLFNAQGVILQWYVDICLRLGATPEQIPWMDDLFLDIVIWPDGGFTILDADELEEALAAEEISKDEYDLAWRVSENLIAQITAGEFKILNLSERHRHVLLQTTRVE